jgi:hypothetical protein
MPFSIEYSLVTPNVHIAKALTARVALNAVRGLKASHAEVKSIRSSSGSEITIGELEDLAEQEDGQRLADPNARSASPT